MSKYSLFEEQQLFNPKINKELHLMSMLSNCSPLVLAFVKLIPFLQYGISGPYWYAGGATIQIIIFSILSIMLKTRAPGAKTFLQVSRVLF